MLSKNHKITKERERIETNKKKMLLNYPELFSKEELRIDIDNKNKLSKHSKFLLDYIKTQNTENKESTDNKNKLQKALKDLLK